MMKKTFIALADTVRQLDLELYDASISVPQRSDAGFQTEPKRFVLLDDAHRNIKNYLAGFCQSQNPKFDRARWLGYISGECGPGGGKIKPGDLPTCRNCGEEWGPSHEC